MTITITKPLDQFNHVSSISMEVGEDITSVNLITQVITPLLVAEGYHINSIKTAYEVGAVEIEELIDSLKDN